MTHRQALESMYKGTCRLYESRQVKEEETKITMEKRVFTEQEFPCRLSFTTSTVKEKEGVFVKVQETKLFCAPEREIPAGSLLEITQDGRTALYEQSGYPAVYESHQELALALKEAYT